MSLARRLTASVLVALPAALALALLTEPRPAPAQIQPGGSVLIDKTPIVGGTTGRCLYDNAGKIGETASCGLAGGVTVGTSVITGGTTTRVLFDNAGVLGEYTISGSGNVCMTTNCVMTTPNLGTPSAATLTSATGLPVSTGISGLGTGVATLLTTATTGTNNLVGATSPTLVSPNLGQFTASTGSVVGAGAANAEFFVNGIGSGSGGGGAVTVQNGGANKISIGNYSYIFGGAYDATATLGSSGAIRINGTGTTSCTGVNTSSTGQISCASDGRLKTIAGVFDRGPAAVTSVTPQIYAWKEGTDMYDGGALMVGFIAQDIEPVAPECVNEGNSGFKQLSTTCLIAVLWNTVKSQQQRLSALEAVRP